MKTVPLSQVVQINPRLPRGLEDSREISFVPMASVSEEGGITLQETRNFGEVKRGFTYFQRGDVLLAKITPCFENGKSALADNLEHPIGFGSTEFHVLRTIPGKFDSHFLYHVVRSNKLLFLGQKSMKGAAGHKRVPAEFLENFEVPEWSLDDQIRIAHLLGKVERLIILRKQHLQQLDDLLKSVFLEMFGDPVRNEKGWELGTSSTYADMVTVGVVVKPASYYVDCGVVALRSLNIKPNRIYLNDLVYFPKEANEGVLAKSRLQTDDVVIVRTGKTGTAAVVPAHLDGANCIDLIIVRPKRKKIHPQYLAYLLNSERGMALVASREVGGIQKHFNVGALNKIPFPLPPIDLQIQFATIVEKVEGLKSRYQQSLTDLEALYDALSQQALKGELDLSWVALPAARIEEESPVVAALSTPTAAPTIKLPETELLLPALDNREQLKPLLHFWLEAYRVQLGRGAFAVDHFIAAVQTRLAELHPDNDFELGASDYELTKAWVFEALTAGTLTQVFDDAGNRIELKAAFEKSLV